MAEGYPKLISEASSHKHQTFLRKSQKLKSDSTFEKLSSGWNQQRLELVSVTGRLAGFPARAEQCGRYGAVARQDLLLQTGPVLAAQR